MKKILYNAPIIFAILNFSLLVVYRINSTVVSWETVKKITGILYQIIPPRAMLGLGSATIPVIVIAIVLFLRERISNKKFIISICLNLSYAIVFFIWATKQ